MVEMICSEYGVYTCVSLRFGAVAYKCTCVCLVGIGAGAAGLVCASRGLSVRSV